MIIAVSYTHLDVYKRQEKVYLAKNLEPKIPEECLVTKLSYHYEEGIARARLCGQIKTIQSMAALLENYEHENYYRRSRQRNDYQLRDRNNTANNNNNQNKMATGIIDHE